jgi:hypothetical protein
MMKTLRLAAAAGLLATSTLLTRDPRPTPTNAGSRWPAFQGQRLMGTFTGVSYNADTHTVEATLSTGARCAATSSPKNWKSAPKRSTWAARRRPGQAARQHNQYEADAVVGTVSNVRIEGGELLGTLKFGETDNAKKIEGMVARGELTGISIGYRVTPGPSPPSKTSMKPGARRAGNCSKSALFQFPQTRTPGFARWRAIIPRRRRFLPQPKRKKI